MATDEPYEPTLEDIEFLNSDHKRYIGVDKPVIEKKTDQGMHWTEQLKYQVQSEPKKRYVPDTEGDYLPTDDQPYD